jgi:hypothetical protein
MSLRAFGDQAYKSSMLDTYGQVIKTRVQKLNGCIQEHHGEPNAIAE